MRKRVNKRALINGLSLIMSIIVMAMGILILEDRSYYLVSLLMLFIILFSFL